MSSPLPFLKEKTQAGVVAEHRESPETPAGLMAVSDELIQAIESKDAKGVAMALQNAFYLLDSEPHEEGPHE